MKIGFFGVKEEDKKGFYKQNLPGHELIFIDEAVNENKLPGQRDFEIICIFVDCKITSKVIDQFPNLKYITTRSTGFDHIDYEYANKKIFTYLTSPLMVLTQLLSLLSASYFLY